MQDLLIDSILIILIFSVVPIGAAGLSSGLVSLIQAVMQVQEQSVIHLARILSFALIVWLLGEFAYHEMEDLALRCMTIIQKVALVSKNV